MKPPLGSEVVLEVAHQLADPSRDVRDRLGLAPADHVTHEICERRTLFRVAP